MFHIYEHFLISFRGKLPKMPKLLKVPKVNSVVFN